MKFLKEINSTTGKRGGGGGGGSGWGEGGGVDGGGGGEWEWMGRGSVIVVLVRELIERSWSSLDEYKRIAVKICQLK